MSDWLSRLPGDREREAIVFLSFVVVVGSYSAFQGWEEAEY